MAKVGRCASNWFKNVKQGPPDAILGLNEAFKKDTDSKKVNLGVGAYRDDNGKPWILPSVRKAEDKIIQRKLDKEYSTIIGIPSFYKKAAEVAFGNDSPALNEKRSVTAQAISGTGSLRVGATFLGQNFEGCKVIYVPNPTWGNHNRIFEHSGLEVKKYTYYDPKTRGLNFDRMLSDICKMPEESIILLHACAHNPTGVDPTTEQWSELSELIRNKKIFPFIDMAYQGFASGDLDHDARALRIFEADGHSFCLAQSFAKNMGLYGERVGAVTFVCDDSDEAERVMSQMKIIIRAMYSNPPLHGARIAGEILNDPDLYCEWVRDLKSMSGRIITMRKELKQKLVSLGSKHNWDHITNQIGMFAYTGLDSTQVKRLIEEKHIYLTNDGRISMAGLNSKNVSYVAESIYEMTN